MLFATLTSLAALLLGRASPQEVANTCLEGGKAGSLDLGKMAEKKCDLSGDDVCLTLAVMDPDGNGDAVTIRRCPNTDWLDCDVIQDNREKLLVENGIEMMSCSACKGKNCNNVTESTAVDPSIPGGAAIPFNQSEHKHVDERKTTRKTDFLGKEGVAGDQTVGTTSDTTGVIRRDVFAIVVLVTFTLLRFVV